VAGLSIVFFGDSLGWLRTLGIVAIVLGVAVLGKDGRK
jgi:multidrug transporter EmrE-like cation transporter